MTSRLAALAAAAVLALPAGAALALPPSPTYGTFADLDRQRAIEQVYEEMELGIVPECSPEESRDDEILLGDPDARSPLGRGGTDDDDATHYARGRTLVINVYIDHSGGTWQTSEKQTMAARNSVAKDFYLAEAPADANLSFDNQGTNGYWEYTVTLGYDIPDDGLTWAMTEDAMQGIGFGDGDGDGRIIDDMTIWLQNWNGGWDNVIAMFQPADISGQAFAGIGLARIRQYTDDSALVRSHEMGHNFGACDEYANGCSSCGVCSSTYLDDLVDNGNCESGSCPLDIPCKMRYNTDVVCPYTVEHWAWFDENSNGMLDLVKRRVLGETFVNIYEIPNNGNYVWNNTSHGYVYAQRWQSWSVVGVRSPATADYDLKVYGDNNHNYELAYSGLGGSTVVDFVVADYNHTPRSNEHVEILKWSGDSADYRVGWESGTAMLYPDGIERAGSWSAPNVVRVWDVPLFAGETVTFVLDVTSGSLDLGMGLYKSNGGPYWAARGSAEFTRDSGGAAATETFTYTAPADDVYGFVVWSNTYEAGTFDITIGPGQVALAEETPFHSAFPLRLFQYDPNSSYWSFAGNRPASGTNTTVRLFDDPNYQDELVVSDDYNSVNNPSLNLDFVAVDYNHVGTAIDYPRIIRESGTGTHRTEWEHDADILAGATSSANWDSGHVGKVWDAFLVGGQSYFLRQYHSFFSSLDTGIYLFDSGNGDYYQARTQFAQAANFRPPADLGEWFSFTAPSNDWYGVILIANDEEEGPYSLWLGPHVPMANDVAQTWSDEVLFGSGSVGAGYWHVFAARPQPSEKVDVWLYGDNAYTIGTLAASDQSGTGVVNYVVGDYNHNPVGVVYPRFRRSSGSGDVTIEFDGGTETVAWAAGDPPVEVTYVWPQGDVAEAFDVLLPAGQNVRIDLDVLSGTPDFGIALFKSSGGTYYANPSGAQASADWNGPGEGESLELVTPGLDWYGLIVTNENGESGRFRITIGDAAAVSVDALADAPGFVYESSPNPFRESTDLRFSIPQDDRVRIAVYNAAGQLVRTLADEGYAAGRHAVSWDGRDAAGRTVATGVYLARLQTSSRSEIRKVLRIQ